MIESRSYRKQVEKRLSFFITPSFTLFFLSLCGQSNLDGSSAVGMHLPLHISPAFNAYVTVSPSPTIHYRTCPISPRRPSWPLSRQHRICHAHMSATAKLETSQSSTSQSSTPPSLSSPTFICTSLTAPTVTEQVLQAEHASRAGADLVEIRVDLLEHPHSSEWTTILAKSPLPAIVTNRASWEGGNSTQPEVERLRLIIDAITRNASHVDVELKALPTFLELLKESNLSLPLQNTKLILSHHNFERPLSPEEISSVQQQMLNGGADVCKIAMKATSALDNALIFRTLQNATTPTILLAMGDLGQVSRIVAPRFNAYLTFASIGKGAESAPGQVDTETLVQMYRFREITPSTPIFGVIGNPVSHSMSPALHNAALSATGLKGVYVPLKVEDRFADFITSMSQFGFEGFSITIPGKVPAMGAMDVMDPVAEKIGAMNTVVKLEDSRLKGYNTDWVAAISAVEEQVSGGIQGKHVVVIGAGGAGRGLAFGALERGAARITIVNRTRSKAIELAKEMGERATGMSLEEFDNAEGMVYDVLMNSTSVGMHPHVDEMPVRKEKLLKGCVVFDAVYNPLKTQLLKEAEKAGCSTVSGLEMFVRQAAEQFRLWFDGVDVPVDRMREVVLERLSR